METIHVETLGIFSLAARLQVNMILDDRHNGHSDARAAERVLGPCYARLVNNPQVNSRYVNRIVHLVSKGCREAFTILILTDAGQAESFAQLVSTACTDRVDVKVVQTNCLGENASERNVRGTPKPH